VITSQLTMNTLNSNTYQFLVDVELNSCTLNDKIFSGSLLKNNSFKQVTFVDCVFFATDIEKTNFIGCEFINCQFQFVNIRSCEFSGCKFNNLTWVQGSTLYNHFSSCELDFATIDHIEKGTNKMLNCFSKQMTNPQMDLNQAMDGQTIKEDSNKQESIMDDEHTDEQLVSINIMVDELSRTEELEATSIMLTNE
jgi:uncharacterized protein YjbI with pentapeptide repeats